MAVRSAGAFQMIGPSVLPAVFLSCESKKPLSPKPSLDQSGYIFGNLWIILQHGKIVAWKHQIRR